MAIKELKREWSPEQLDYVKHYLLHWERDVKDLPACCVGSRATVSETDHEYVCTAECGWVREEFKELAAICPEALTDPDVKILYDPDKTTVGNREYLVNAALGVTNGKGLNVVYFPNVKLVDQHGFNSSDVRVAVLPNCEEIRYGAFMSSNLQEIYAPKLSAITGYGNTFSKAKLAKVSFPALVSIGPECGAVFGQLAELESIDLPELESLSEYATGLFEACTNLSRVNVPKLANVTRNMFRECTALAKLDLPSVTSIARQTFYKDGVYALILRSETVVTLDNTNAFTDDPIASGTGYIYVPAALIEDYKVATNWSTYAAQFRAIEDYPEICDPTMDDPITKGEATALIDSKLEGAGGGGVDADFVTRTTDEVECLLEEQVLAGEWQNTGSRYYGVKVQNEIAIVAGAQYRVVFDGTPFILNAVQESDLQYWFGNFTMTGAGGADNGIPFCVNKLRRFSIFSWLGSSCTR